eukprot:6178182-Pleurochrysis_carterae.AAC.2
MKRVVLQGLKRIMLSIWTVHRAQWTTLSGIKPLAVCSKWTGSCCVKHSRADTGFRIIVNASGTPQDILLVFRN